MVTVSAEKKNWSKLVVLIVIVYLISVIYHADYRISNMIFKEDEVGLRFIFVCKSD